MDEISIGGEGAEWQVFSRRDQDGHPVVVRSRLAQAPIRTFAAANFMARLRCVLGADQLNDEGMPRSTNDLDEFEDQLLASLKTMNSKTYDVAVVTGGGFRDLFFAAADGDDLLAAIRSLPDERSFKIQLSRLEGAKARLLESLIPSP
jgi:hypothetical protein